ncbi:sensory transduction histidine kinase [Tanticharoenia sakaeratensis NBRC 103193]|uniref:histidine kinase n=1 Tax=Tanticharoenia sakaeratensis NBRC 103193 TaxID=1231623 RepID=A0A0D6MJG6_9PROT|nr:sensory transduction histidine kinase [Tanticharoenia sakaeratensis NBRC 103193]GBQ20715.1 two component hybrid sensor histidine kinase and regulator [Tanticharoenia sakaeratensis NBRC 103193]
MNGSARRWPWSKWPLKSAAWFDTVGSRVVSLMLGATMPLAIIAALLAWRAYVSVASQATGSAVGLASQINGEIERDIDRTTDTLTVISEMASNTSAMAGQFALIQSVTLHRYCLMELRDESGVPLVSVRGTSSDGCPGGLTGSEPMTGSVGQTGIINVRGQLLSLVKLPCHYRDNAGHDARGVMLGIRTLGWQNDALPRDDSRHTLLTALAGHAWFVTPGNAPFPVIINQAGGDALDPGVVARLERQEARKQHSGEIVYTKTHGGTWAMGPAFGPARVVVATMPTQDEAHALRLFVWRVFLITTFLALELVLVAIAAHAFLVDPMETLASAVMEWRRGGAFAPDLGRAVPLELRHLERAMTRATMRLNRHEARLRRAAQNQTLLIREIHHRVKNNLQVVASLLNLQASRVRSPEAREEFRLVRDRVRALATLHRYLYPDGGISQLDVRSFMDELCRQIFTANGFTETGRVRLDLDVQTVAISPDQAVPLALIVTEVLSNALRHAYPDDGTGRVLVRLAMDGDQAELIVADNGVGIAATRTDDGRRPGIGLQLIRGFARQIRASLDIETEHGTRYRLRFTPENVRRTENIT